MRLNKTLASTAAIAVIVSALTVHAQTPGAETRTASASKSDAKTSGSNIRVSQLIGANLHNDQGESVGQINDLVLDSATGKVRYAAVTYGGFLGMGDKMFAVPFAAIKTKTSLQDAGNYVLVLNVTQQQLEGAQGFDQDHWPNMADEKFSTELNRRYGVEHTQDSYAK